MFYDRAKIYVKGGDGGNGIVAFRREKYVEMGGPYGGDGGKGGDVIFEADEGLRTLVDFRYQRHYKADRGEHGGSKNMHGAKADNMVVRVPVGTQVFDAETGEFIADLTEHNQRATVAKGGRGGRGNSRFATATDKAPHYAEKGEPGEEHWVELELKLLADVGLIGFPSVGKSTLISVVSAAKPKIAEYHFTTLVPNLGMVRVDDGRSFVMADLPGLIEGAHTGAGLGHQFLRHSERTRLLIHVLDMAGSEGRDPVEDFSIINNELSQYSQVLADRKQLIAANKMDLPQAEENLERFKKAYGENYEIFSISAVSGQGTDALIYRAIDLLDTLQEVPVVNEVEKITTVTEEPGFTVEREDDIFVISGREIERRYAMTNFNQEDSLKRFLRTMRLMGIDDELRRQGAKDGDTVRVGDLVFDFVD